MLDMPIEYILALLELRMVADSHKDDRSLVAIAAAFERNVSTELAIITESIKVKSHNRNDTKLKSDRNKDRHSEGYMRDYMRKRRAKENEKEA